MRQTSPNPAAVTIVRSSPVSLGVHSILLDSLGVSDFPDFPVAAYRVLRARSSIPARATSQTSTASGTEC
jgi:hypothetical protein